MKLSKSGREASLTRHSWWQPSGSLIIANVTAWHPPMQSALLLGTVHFLCSGAWFTTLCFCASPTKVTSFWIRSYFDFNSHTSQREITILLRLLIVAPDRSRYNISVYIWYIPSIAWRPLLVTHSMYMLAYFEQGASLWMQTLPISTVIPMLWQFLIMEACGEAFSLFGLVLIKEHNAQRGFWKWVYSHAFIEGFPQWAVGFHHRAVAGSVVVLTRRMPRAPHCLPYREPRAPISAALIHGATLNGIPDSTQVYSD